ncbi:regulator of sigma E protease [Trypanosoma cruzi]|nr:regulator of sigma E protease [Trypanosoma cruzi]
MPRHLNAACMAALKYVFPGSLASVVLVGSVSRHHEEGSSPGIADKHSPLQITASISLTSSAESVMGKLSIGRFADISWILRLHTNRWNANPKRSVWQKRPLRRACSNIHSCSVRSTSSAAAGAHNRCHPLIPRVALPPARLQRPPVPIDILQLHAINVVAVVVLTRGHRGSRRVHHHQQRPATYTGNIPHHAAAGHVRVVEPESMGHQVRGDANVEASVK